MEKIVTIDVERIIKAVLQKWYLAVLVAVCAALLMFVFKYDSVQEYSASTTIYSSAYGSYTQTAEGVKAVQLFADIVYSNKIAERAVSILGDNTLDVGTVRGMIGVNVPEDSPVMTIYARGKDPLKTVAVSNAVAEAFIIETQNITAGESIQILDRAQEAYAISAGLKRKCAVAFLAGAFLVAAIIALREILSDRVYRVEDASLGGELEILGIIPDQKID